MQKIKEQLRGILFIAFLVIGFAFLAPNAWAATPGLAVDFETSPLFSESNFVPGDAVIKGVGVANSSGEDKILAIEAINIIDNDNLSQAFDFEVMKGDTTLYSDTLYSFFQAGETAIDTIMDGGSVDYKFVVTFRPSSGDEWQTKTLENFDILVGWQGEEGGESGGGGSGGSSGGGGSLPRGLTIYNETEIDITETTATITWHTNYSSTSRVVYSAESEPHTFLLSDTPNYGYVHSSPEFDTPALVNGVTFHTIHLTGLNPGTLYYYRAISHASPDTVGLQYSFRTNTGEEGEDAEEDEGDGSVDNNTGTGDEGAGVSEEPQVAEDTAPATIVGGGGAGDNLEENAEDGGESSGEDVVAGASEENEEGGSRVAGAGTCSPYPWWIYLFIVLCYLVTLYFYKKRVDEKEIKSKNKFVFPVVLTVVVVIIIIALLKCWF